MYLDPPRLQINLGRNLNVSNIKEGSDVYFECTIKASPAITRLDWDHNVSILKFEFNLNMFLVMNKRRGVKKHMKTNFKISDFFPNAISRGQVLDSTRAEERF